MFKRSCRDHRRQAGCEGVGGSARSKLYEHLDADSLDTVELIMEFEKAFDIQIPDEDAEKIATVGDAISYIEAHKK